MANPVGKNEYGDDIYSTPNGQKTGTQITQELNAAGWQGQGDPVSVYNQTAGGQPSSPGAPSNSGTPANNAAPTQTGANIAAGQLLLQQAQNAANQAYLNARLAMESDQEAYQKAAQAAATEIAKAGVTGTYNGMPTQAAIKQAADIASQQAQTMVSYAQQFGSWGVPQSGQQTLAAQQQQFNQAQQAAQLTGWYTPTTYRPSPAPGATSPTLGMQPVNTLPYTGGAGGGQAGGLGYPAGTVIRTNGNQFGIVNADGSVTPGDASNPTIYAAIQRGSGIPTVTDQQWSSVMGGGQTAQDQYIQARTAQLQQVASMPAAQAQQTATAEWNQGYAQSGNVAYGMPTQQPSSPYATQTPQYLQQQPQQADSTTYGAPPGYQQGQPVQTLAAQQQYWQQQFDTQKQQQATAQNYLNLLSQLRGPADYAQYQKVLGATPGGMQSLVAAAAGQYVPGGGATTGVQPQGVTLQSFLNQATGGQFGGGTTPTGTQSADQAALNSLVAPNQMAPQTWNALQPSQQQLLLGQWESQGYTQQDAQNLFNQSLPKYGTSGSQAGSFKLQ